MIEFRVTGNPLAQDQQLVHLVKRVTAELRHSARTSCVVAFTFEQGDPVKFRMTYVRNKKGPPRRRAAPDGAH